MSATPYFSLTVDVPVAALEAAQSVLHEAGATGLEVRDGDGPLMPGARAPKEGLAIVIAYFLGKRAAGLAEKAVLVRWPDLDTRLDEVEMRDWSVEWKTRIRSVRVGRLWVGPPWDKPKAPRDAVCLFIEPKMAFGTGDHPTTALCLAAVDEYLGKHPKASVLDVGTGTGVLALAAKKLGAARVVGTDNDPVAVGLALECAEENGLKGVEFSLKALPKVKGTFDLVLANILANTLIALAPQLSAKTGDRLVLAGILKPQADDVVKAFVARGLLWVGSAFEGDWVRLDFQKSR